jgi:hypothetical protein
MPAKVVHSATRWIEEKLQNVRRRINKEKNNSVVCSSTIAPTSKLIKITDLPGV